jgi:hypothetical protein
MRKLPPPPRPIHNHRPLKMSKTRNIRRLKKCSHALPSLPWLGDEQEEGWGGRCKGKTKGRKRMAVRSGTARGVFRNEEKVDVKN